MNGRSIANIFFLHPTFPKNISSWETTFFPVNSLHLVCKAIVGRKKWNISEIVSNSWPVLKKKGMRYYFPVESRFKHGKGSSQMRYQYLSHCFCKGILMNLFLILLLQTLQPFMTFDAWRKHTSQNIWSSWNVCEKLKFVQYFKFGACSEMQMPFLAFMPTRVNHYEWMFLLVHMHINEKY